MITLRKIESFLKSCLTSETGWQNFLMGMYTSGVPSTTTPVATAIDAKRYFRDCSFPWVFARHAPRHQNIHSTLTYHRISNRAHLRIMGSTLRDYQQKKPLRVEFASPAQTLGPSNGHLCYSEVPHSVECDFSCTSGHAGQVLQETCFPERNNLRPRPPPNFSHRVHPPIVRPFNRFLKIDPISEKTLLRGGGGLR